MDASKTSTVPASAPVGGAQPASMNQTTQASSHMPASAVGAQAAVSASGTEG